jgi:hypothetical protein
MASFYTEQTKTVDLGKGNSATLRKLSYGEVSSIFSACRLPGGEVDGVRYSRMQAEMGLVSWEGPGFEGKPATPENLRALPVRIGRTLAEAAAELNTDVGEDEGNASGGASS